MEFTGFNKWILGTSNYNLYTAQLYGNLRLFFGAGYLSSLADTVTTVVGTLRVGRKTRALGREAD
jgi:hypothetical protein